MSSSTPLRVLITGASRGIGAAVARCYARRHPGVHLALLARSSLRPVHSALRGTLQEVAKDCEDLGAVALPLQVNLQDPVCTDAVVRNALRAFGGLDVLVNNASALDTRARPKPKHTALVTDVNVRGTLVVSLACADALSESGGAMVTLSPPIDTQRPDYLARHVHYTVSKYAMTHMTLGFAAEGICRANCLWPRYTVSTAATEALELNGLAKGAFSRGRDPEEVAEAVVALAASPLSGMALLDDEALPTMRPPPEKAVLDLFVEA